MTFGPCIASHSHWPHSDIDELHRVHKIVSLACLGLWISGVALIGVRTNFDLAAFSPKLWSKVIVVTVLTLNAILLNTAFIPALSRAVGARLIELPLRSLLPMALCAGVSLSGWLLALALGSSSVLKVTKWDVLVPVLAGSTAVCITSVLLVVFGARTVMLRATVEPQTPQST